MLLIELVIPSVWYLIDTVRFCCNLLCPFSMHDDQLLFFATVETVMSHGSLLKATLKAILTYGYGELASVWGWC